jgi:glycosyltransferase involved in cell wall biosynthesis
MRRIAHCIHGLGLGGAQRIVEQLVTGCGGFRHFVYSPTDGVFRDGIEQAGATMRIVHRGLPKLDPIWVLKLSRAMRRDGIDLVHGHLFGDSLHGYLSARVAGGVPMVVTLHSTLEYSTTLQRLGYRWLLPRCDAVVTCSEAVRRSFVTGRVVPEHAVTTIHNGVPDPMKGPGDPGSRDAIRRELGLDPSTTVIATIGRLEPEKGQAYLLQAFARLAREVSPPPRLVFLGDGSLRDGLCAEARDMGIAPLVLFAGFRPDVTRLLPAFDAVVISSVFEGMSVAMLEAMAAGRCIVATDIPGVIEAVREGREALLVPVRDVAGLAEALRRVASDPALRERLGAAARQRFLGLFGPGRMVTAYGNLYRTIGERRRPNGRRDEQG